MLGTRIDGTVVVIECAFSINLTALTLEQVLSKRHKLVEDTVSSMVLEMRTLTGDVSADKLKSVLGERILSEEPEYFNNDANFSQAMLKAIAPFAKDPDFEASVVKSAEMLAGYRHASVAVSGACAAFEMTKTELEQMQRDFTERQQRADEIAASVAQRVQQVELEIPKPRGRPPIRRESVGSLGCGDEAFSSQEEASGALSSLLQQQEEHAAASLSFGDDNDEMADEDEDARSFNPPPARIVIFRSMNVVAFL